MSASYWAVSKECTQHAQVFSAGHKLACLPSLTSHYQYRPFSRFLQRAEKRSDREQHACREGQGRVLDPDRKTTSTSAALEVQLALQVDVQQFCSGKEKTLCVHTSVAD